MCGYRAKAGQLSFLWIKSNVPLYAIFVADVDQLLKAIAATSQKSNVISI